MSIKFTQKSGIKNAESMMYTIKIECTHRFYCNGRKIQNKPYIKLQLKELVNQFDYITKSVLLFKTLKKTTTKRLEFVCNREISQSEFVEFIKSMKEIGFSSESNKCIKFVKNEPYESIYKFNFDSYTPVLEKKKENKKNKSTYYVQCLYTK